MEANNYPPLASVRERCGWTRTNFAVAVDVTEGTVYGWETGRSTPPIRRVRQIVTILNRSRPPDMPELSIEDVFGGPVPADR
jgi:DNA-binding XRE family transcriptional regulator